MGARGNHTESGQRNQDDDVIKGPVEPTQRGKIDLLALNGREGVTSLGPHTSTVHGGGEGRLGTPAATRTAFLLSATTRHASAAGADHSRIVGGVEGTA